MGPGLVVALAMAMQAHPDPVMNTHFNDVLGALRRTRNAWYAVGLGLLVIGLPVTILPHFSDEAPHIQNAASAAGLFFVVVAGVLLHKAWQLHDPIRAPLTEMLLNRPRDIAWVYIEQINSRAAGVTLSRAQIIKVCTVGKKTLPLNVSGDQVDAVMAALYAYLPHATFGYDLATQQRYKANPASLVDATI